MSKDKKPFYWGASTASHQVEGGTENQWSVWELASASHAAKHAAHQQSGAFVLKDLPNWHEIEAQATDPNNYVSGPGVDHYNKYVTDFDILKELNLNAFRFTVEWSRIEPEKGKYNPEAIEHYRTYIKELRARNIEPFLNIWHWTLPTWFAEAGGFSKRRNIKHFEKFVQLVTNELLHDVDYVITINEPNVYSSFSYITGDWPPEDKNTFRGIWTYINLMSAHKRAYGIIKAKYPRMQVGVAQQLADIEPYTQDRFMDEAATKLMRYGWNWWWLNRIKKYQDFVGFNYYFTDYYQGWNRKSPDSPLSDMGWYMEPKGILPLMRKIAKHYPGKPIFVTENGVADSKDQYRKWWLTETMEALDEAKAENIPIAGYFHWSLLDNFEWAYGWWPKFGLVEVDREHGMKRTIRPSAKWWAGELKKRGN
jgi:beta-glucosidase